MDAWVVKNVLQGIGIAFGNGIIVKKSGIFKLLFISVMYACLWGDKLKNLTTASKFRIFACFYM